MAIRFIIKNFTQINEHAHTLTQLLCLTHSAHTHARAQARRKSLARNLLRAWPLCIYMSIMSKGVYVYVCLCSCTFIFHLFCPKFVILTTTLSFTYIPLLLYLSSPHSYIPFFYFQHRFPPSFHSFTICLSAVTLNHMQIHVTQEPVINMLHLHIHVNHFFIHTLALDRKMHCLHLRVGGSLLIPLKRDISL